MWYFLSFVSIWILGNRQKVKKLEIILHIPIEESEMKFDFFSCLGYYDQCCNEHDGIHIDHTAFIIIMIKSIGWLEDGKGLKVKKYTL